MKAKIFVAGWLSLALAACQGGGVQAPTVSSSTDAGDFSSKYVSVVLPATVDFDFQYALVRDRVYVNNGSRSVRRGIMLEFTDGDTSTIAASLAGSFSKEGFKSKALPAMSSGSAFVLTKKGIPDIRVEVRDVGGRKMRVGGAKGTVWMSWEIMLPK